MAEVLHGAHTGWLDGREPDFSEETTRAKLSEVIHREGVADGIPDVPALKLRIGQAEEEIDSLAGEVLDAEARVEALQAERDELDRRMMSATERIAKQSDALRAAEYRVLYGNGSYTRGIFDAQEAITLASLYRDAVVEGRTCWATSGRDSCCSRLSTTATSERG